MFLDFLAQLARLNYWDWFQLNKTPHAYDTQIRKEILQDMCYMYWRNTFQVHFSHSSNVCIWITGHTVSSDPLAFSSWEHSARNTSAASGKKRGLSRADLGDNVHGTCKINSQTLRYTASGYNFWEQDCNEHRRFDSNIQEKRVRLTTSNTEIKQVHMAGYLKYLSKNINAYNLIALLHKWSIFSARYLLAKGDHVSHSIETYQSLTRGMSMARRVRPHRRLNGRGAQSKAMPVGNWDQTMTSMKTRSPTQITLLFHFHQFLFSLQYEAATLPTLVDEQWASKCKVNELDDFWAT